MLALITHHFVKNGDKFNEYSQQNWIVCCPFTCYSQLSLHNLSGLL